MDMTTGDRVRISIADKRGGYDDGRIGTIEQPDDGSPWGYDDGWWLVHIVDDKGDHYGWFLTDALVVIR